MTGSLASFAFAAVLSACGGSGSPSVGMSSAGASGQGSPTPLGGAGGSTLGTGGSTQGQGGNATTAGSSGSAGSGVVAAGEGLIADFSKGSLVATLNGTPSPELFRFVREDAVAAATYFDETGTLKVAELGAPRFDHQPGSATALGLLLEPAAQNLLLEANGFPAWMAGGAASKVVAAAGAGPDATNTASNLAFTAGGGSRRFSPMLSVGAGVAVTYSVWGKAKGNTDLRLEIWGTEVDPLKQDFALSNGWSATACAGWVRASRSRSWSTT